MRWHGPFRQCRTRSPTRLKRHSRAKAINGIAGSVDQVLTQADGQTVTTTGGQGVVHTKGATVVTINEDLIQSFLHTLDDPNIAFILLVIGVLLIAIEFFHPTLLMGLVGALCLALSFYGSGSLPLNVLGVILVVLGVGMIVIEPNLPSHGILTVGGIVVFVVGAVAFYGSPGPYLPTSTVAWPVIVLMAAAAAAYGLLLVGTLMRMRSQPAPVGAGLVGLDKVVGLVGEVRADLAPVGTSIRRPRRVVGQSEGWQLALAGDEGAGGRPGGPDSDRREGGLAIHCRCCRRT